MSLEAIKKNNSNFYPTLSVPINISGLLNDLKLINLDNGDIINSEPIDIIILSSFDGKITIGEVINTLAENYEYDESCKIVFTILNKYKDLITWSTNKLEVKNEKFCPTLFDIKNFKLKKAYNQKIEFPNIISLLLTDKCNFRCK